MFFQIPRMPLFLGLCMIGFLLLYELVTLRNLSFLRIKPIWIWLFFSVYTLLSGFFIASDISHLASSWFTYFQTLVMLIFIVEVSAIEKDNSFFVKAYLLFSVIYMLSMLFFGVEFGGRVTLSETSNPNGDGLTLVFGIFCTLYLMDSKKIVRFISSMALVGLLTHTITLTASRKSFMAAILLIVFWLVLVFPKIWNGYSLMKKILSLTFIVVAAGVVFVEFVPSLLESTLYQRLIQGMWITEDVTRMGMYREGMKFFIENPLLGIGFNHYRLLSVYKTYSHSTYVEVLSTTGILGTVIYFSAYLVIIYNLASLYFKTKGTMTSVHSLNYLLLMFIMLALGTGVIHFYGIIYYIMFALMISFCHIEKKKIAETFSARANLTKRHLFGGNYNGKFKNRC